MARYRKNPSLIQIALDSGWEFSAVISLVVLILIYLVFPLLMESNQFLKVLLPAFRPLGLIIAFGFGALASMKLMLVLFGALKTSMVDSGGVKSKTKDQYFKQPVSKQIGPWANEYLKGLNAKKLRALCEFYFNERGMKVTRLHREGDDGEYLQLDETNSGEVTAIASIQYASESIDLETVIRFFRVMKCENIRRGYFFTNSSFSDTAIDFASTNKIRLIDSSDLLRFIKGLPQSSTAKLLTLINNFDMPDEKLNSATQETVIAKNLGEHGLHPVFRKLTHQLLCSLEWKRFEDLCAGYFTEIGIKNNLTPLGADGGVDIQLYEDDASNKPTCLVQCKAYTKPVGIKLMREFIGVMHLEKVSRGIYITTSGFNAAAVSAARENNIQLIDGYQLVNLIERLPVEIQDKLVKYVTAGDYTTPTCVQCGIKMVRRKSNDKEFWGCKNFPKCRRTLMG